MSRAALIIGTMVFIELANAQSPDNLLLKNYRPQSIYNIPQTKIEKARFPVIDMHSHAYATTKEELHQWVANMDQFGIEKTVILTYSTGDEFDSLVETYSVYKDRFELWCGIDYSGYQESDWSKKAIKELERCHKKGAKGVGELGDKGVGLLYSHPTPAQGMHLDDERMKPLLKRCGELGMPVNIHIAEPIWMYSPMDSTNDGLYNAFKWKVNQSQEGFLGHGEMIGTLENAVKANPGTIFIACHFANCSYDLSILEELLNTYPNLYADISARYGETAPIPRRMKEFYSKYQDRLFFGTDMGTEKIMYEVVFRILETDDEHFYQQDYFNYHWPLHGFGLPDEILKKLYHENAQKLMAH